MAYTNHDTFLKEYYKVENTKIERGEKVFPAQHASVEDAWHLYTDTFALKSMGVRLDGQPSQFMGRLVSDDFIKLMETGDLKNVKMQLPNDLIGIGNIEKKNLLTLDNYIDNGGKWTSLINDCWLLAGVNSLQQYYACSPIIWKNVLDKNYAVTVTGRELIGLTLAGYSEKQVSGGGKCFVYTLGKEEQARGLSLTDYDDQMVRLKDEMQAKVWFASNCPFEIE
jgi:hypothetical protein